MNYKGFGDGGIKEKSIPQHNYKIEYSALRVCCHLLLLLYSNTFPRGDLKVNPELFSNICDNNELFLSGQQEPRE